MFQLLGHNLIFFKEENCLNIKYGLVIEIYIGQEFSLILLTTLKEGIDHNQNTNLEDLQEYSANFEVDKVNRHKTNEQTDFKLQLYW